MITREELKRLVIEALSHLNGTGRVVDVCIYIWENYEDELRASGEMFFTWQYDTRRAGQALRDEGIIRSDTKRGPWILNKEVGL